jgi:hypothetical protein
MEKAKKEVFDERKQNAIFLSSTEEYAQQHHHAMLKPTAECFTSEYAAHDECSLA